MSEGRERIERGVSALYRRAVRVPLPDMDAERAHYWNMARIAEGADRMADLLADPDVPLIDAYEDQTEEMRRGFEHRLARLAGEDYHDVATAYAEGERDDWIGELAVYYRECLLRLEERTALDETVCRLLVLRYPDCVTVNFSFVEGALPADAVRFESPTYADVSYDDAYGPRYYAESQYAQKEAADYFRRASTLMREQFPDPAETTRGERAYGGFVYLTGRHGPTFADVVEAVDPNLERFDDAADEPRLVPEGPEAKRIEREFLADAEIVA